MENQLETPKYTYEYSPYGYKVFRDGVFVHGAGRDRDAPSLKGRQVESNRKFMREQAEATIRQLQREI